MITKPTILSFNRIQSPNGSLFIYEKGNGYDFNSQRSFAVFANEKDERGKHAHKKCNQLLICLKGEICINIYGKNYNDKFLIDHPNKGILIPPSFWSTQIFLKNDSIMLVICDMLYDEKDYIRDFETFKMYINKEIS